MPGECGSVLHASLVAMVRHAWQVQQQSESRHTLHHGANCGTAKAQDEVPSQWPGTARSAAHAGRGLIMISGEMKVLPRPRVRALGIRNTRPVRKQAVSSRRNAPRL